MPIFSPSIFSPAIFSTGGGSATPLTFGAYGGAIAAFSNTATFSALAIGAAAADRWVVAAIYVSHDTSRALGTVTIGGVAATLLYGAPTLSASGGRWEFWKANVPTGTTANVVITTVSGSFFDAGCSVYFTYGNPTLFAAAFDNTFTGSTLSVSIDVPQDGALIALVSNDNFSSVTSWVGATQDNGTNFPCASEDLLTAQTGRTVSATLGIASGSTGFFGMAVIALSIPTSGGGGGILDSQAVSVAGSSAAAVAAAIRVAVGTSIGEASAEAGPDLLRSASATAIAAGLAAAPPAAIRSAVAASVGEGQAEAPPAVILSAPAVALAGAVAGAGQAMVCSSLATAVGGSGAVAAAAAIRSAVAVAIAGAVVVGELPGLSYVISVAAAIGGSSAAAAPAAIRVAEASAVASASVRAAAAVILGSQGAATGVSAIAAAQALIRSAPAVALALAQAAAPAAMIRSAPGSAIGRAEAGAPPAMIRGSFATASSLAIMAGLGVLVNAQDYATGRLAFASLEPRRGTILNQAARKGTILNATRRGRIVELDE